MRSLRTRAVAGGAVWATIVALAGANAIGNYLDGLTLARFDDFLAARHSQTIVALANSNGDYDLMPLQLSDPVYQQPFSGNYWQATSNDGRTLVSRSLADALLLTEVSSGSTLEIRDIAGPTDQSLRALTQDVTMNDGTQWIVTVATSTASLEADRRELRRTLYVSFAFVGLLATAGALLIVMFALRPLSQLRRDVTARRDQETELPVEDYPLEVQPLVTDINDLLERNRDIVDRSRRQTADLAHALKTPSAVLRNELFELQSGGTDVQSGLNALDRLDAQLKRSFARMKASQDSSSEREITNLSLSLNRLTIAFEALARNHDRKMVADFPDDLRAKINQIDLEEILGNLLDNALKWSATTLRLQAKANSQWVRIAVEDDGPGISESGEDRAFVSGQRLDQSKPGTGLGLAIASDLVAAYRGKIHIERSELGGAMILVELPRAV